MNLYRSFVVFAALAIAWSASSAVASDDDPVNGIALRPGYNVVTWSGAEPYAVANFEDTPVTRIHRWDAVGQGWLSHVVGRDGATLPELHLLPRVQYLLAVDAAHVLTIANPRTEIDPHAELRFAAAPDDPLRFDAYWPNEDSPLEDLILLRSDDERLSVEAEVAGGVGQVEVYWVLDGRLNHRGLASDDVELLPGKHDDARLYATDETGQAVAVKLPRVVKLPQVEIPEMVYGVNAWGFTFSGDQGPWQYNSRGEFAAILRAISEIGFQIVRFNLAMGPLFEETEPGWENTHVDWLLQTMRDIKIQPLIVIGPHSAPWARSTDLSVDRGWLFNGLEMGDYRHAEVLGRMAARRWPSVTFFQVSNEPNITSYRADLDPIREVQRQRATALGILYENPNAVIVAGTPCCTWFDVWIEDGFVRGINGLTFLEAMYEAGFARWFDVMGIHPNLMPDYHRDLDDARAIMTHYGDGDIPFWQTETPAWWQSEEQYAQLLLEYLGSGTERDDVQGVLIWTIRDYHPRTAKTHPTSERNSGLIDWEYREDRVVLQPSGIAVRDFLRLLERE